MSIATRITIEEYERMIAAGEFDGVPNRSRIELIDGELRDMSPIYPPHAFVVALLSEWSFENRAKEKIWVRVQSPIVIPFRNSVPEPDIVWAARKDYASAHPAASDVLLLIEVADSSLVYDCGEKADLYASAGIADYWVVNIPGRSVEVFRQPDAGIYRNRDVFTAPDEIHPLAFPDVRLSIDQLFSANA